MDHIQSTITKQVSFVCGKLCSGKTKYAIALAESCGALYVEVSDLVRMLKKEGNRSNLQDTKDLHSKITAALQTCIVNAQTTDVVVSGVRQTEILEAFPEATLLWIEASEELRKQRFVSRSRPGDTDFYEAEKGDEALGIGRVKHYILSK